MKSKNLLLVLVVLVLGATLAVAQGPAEGGSPQEGGGRRGGRGMMMNADRLADQLNLTPDQKTKVESILQEQRTQMSALREDTSMSQEDRRTKMQSIMQDTRSKIRDVLNDEQKQKFDQMATQGRGRRGQEGPPQGAPPEPPPNQ
jgi:Spy/CpxP family protein refolding chaperone